MEMGATEGFMKAQIEQLEEENNRLKQNAMEDMRVQTKLEEENKKLKERIDELEKCNLNLQERLDRKEELNKSYRKGIEELSKKSMETWFDEKAKNIFIDKSGKRK